MFPELFRARAFGMGQDRMLFQGYERVGDQTNPDAPMVKQEWAVQVMVAAPAELATSSHRPPT